MNKELLLSRLNLYAVLQNLEDLVLLDTEMADLCRDWNISIEFIVSGGPRAFVAFEKGACRVGRGKPGRSGVKLLFFSPRHLNRMFEKKTQPVILKGFTKIGFLTRDFSRLTERMEHYLAPSDALLADPGYLSINTRLTLNTAAFAVAELVELDPICAKLAAEIPDGAVLMKVLPGGPCVTLEFSGKKARAYKGEPGKFMAAMLMRDIPAANAFLNQKSDAFSAIAAGDVSIWGRIPMLDSLALILDRVPMYLSPPKGD
jgi:hypothetical protein